MSNLWLARGQFWLSVFLILFSAARFDLGLVPLIIGVLFYIDAARSKFWKDL